MYLSIVPSNEKTMPAICSKYSLSIRRMSSGAWRELHVVKPEMSLNRTVRTFFSHPSSRTGLSRIFFKSGGEK